MTRDNDQLAAELRGIADMRGGPISGNLDARILLREAADALQAPRPEETPTEAHRLLGEWLKKAEAHPETREFKGGYQPFLERATREYLALVSPLDALVCGPHGCKLPCDYCGEST